MSNVITLELKNRRASLDQRIEPRRRDDINALVEALSQNLELLKENKALKAENLELKAKVIYE